MLRLAKTHPNETSAAMTYRNRRCGLGCVEVDFEDVLRCNQVVIGPLPKDRTEVSGGSSKAGLFLSIDVEWAVDSSIGISSTGLGVEVDSNTTPRPVPVIYRNESAGKGCRRIPFENARVVRGDEITDYRVLVVREASVDRTICTVRIKTTRDGELSGYVCWWRRKVFTLRPHGQRRD